MRLVAGGVDLGLRRLRPQLCRVPECKIRWLAVTAVYAEHVTHEVSALAASGKDVGKALREIRSTDHVVTLRAVAYVLSVLPLSTLLPPVFCWTKNST